MKASPDVPLPRDSFELQGADGQQSAFAEALSRGRMHHAWLLVGPEGVGKATFAYRAARRLLGASPDPAWGPLGASPEDRASRMVSARSHPDLLVLERVEHEGKLRKTIAVDDARRTPEFFAKAPAAAPWRVAIVDAADDLNPSAANALLKILEEPPERGILFLVSHAPGRILATLRSRCRRLGFRAWSEEDAAAFVQHKAGVDAEQARALASAAKGAPGRAWRMAASNTLELDALAAKLLAGRSRADDPDFLRLTDRFRGGEGQDTFNRFFERLAERLRGDVLDRQAPDDRRAALWERLSALPSEVEGLNLDRGDAFWSAVADVRRAL